MKRTISVLTGLTQHAFRENEMPILRLYFVLRFFYPMGWAFTKQVYKIADEHLFLGRQGTKKLIEKGEGKYWTTNEKTLRIISPKNIDYNPNVGVESQFPIEYFRSLQEFKAFCYAADFAYTKIVILEEGVDPSTRKIPPGFVIISRKKIEEIYGISKTTQIRYEKIAKIHKVCQFIVYKLDEHDAMHIPIRDDGIYRQRGQYVTDIDGDGKMELVSQTANGYRSALQARRTPRRYRQKSLCSDDGQTYKKYFYESISSACKAVTRQRRNTCVLTKRHFVNRRDRVFEALCY